MELIIYMSFFTTTDKILYIWKWAKKQKCNDDGNEPAMMTAIVWNGMTWPNAIKRAPNTFFKYRFFSERRTIWSNRSYLNEIDIPQLTRPYLVIRCPNPELFIW